MYNNKNNNIKISDLVLKKGKSLDGNSNTNLRK